MYFYKCGWNMGQRHKRTNASLQLPSSFHFDGSTSCKMLRNLNEAFEWAHEYLTEFLTLMSSEQFHKKATT